MSFPSSRTTGQEATSTRTIYQQQILKAVRNECQLELLNRIQHVVIFYPLTEQAVRQIIDKALNKLRAQLAERQIQIDLSDDAYMLLMEQGFDVQYGAREMERAVNRLLVQPLARALLEEQFEEAAMLHVGSRDGALFFEDTERTRTGHLS